MPLSPGWNAALRVGAAAAGNRCRQAIASYQVSKLSSEQAIK
jgi:hypothetical protein